MEKIRIIEPICYLYPHKEELVVTSNSIIGVRNYCRTLLKDKHSFLSPLLIDDLKREGYLVEQTVEDVLGDLSTSSCFGSPIMESNIEFYYGKLGCKLFDALYHKDVIISLYLLHSNWSWVVVHPQIFKEQQGGMLLDLWRHISGDILFNNISNKVKIKGDVLKQQYRDEFLKRFEHYWIDENGKMCEHTKPIYKGKKIIHEVIN